MMIEFFSLLSTLQEADKYKDICPNEGFTPDEKISDAYYRLSLANKRWNSGLGMFFVKKPERNMNLFDWLFRPDLETYASGEDIVKAIENMPARKLMYGALRFNDLYNNFNDKFYEDIIENRSVFMSYMNGLNATTDARWEIMSFVQNPDDVISDLKTYIVNMYREFSHEYGLLKEEYDALKEEFENYIVDGTVDSAAEAYETERKRNNAITQISVQQSAPPTSEARVAVLMFTPCRILRIDTMRSTYYTFGVGYMPAFEENSATDGTEKIRDIFKAFTDSTRAQIIEVLHDKECYNGELSKILGVPMSSLTHHMEILGNSGFVLKRIEGKRTYYRINKKQFIYASNMLRRFVEDDEA